jgi:nucleoid DNA-binding protein
MNRQALVEAMAQAIGANKAAAGRMISAVLELIRDGLKQGERVTILGFRIFGTMHPGPRDQGSTSRLRHIRQR